MIVETSTYSEG